MAYYSKNKREKFEELTKIEQKRYEDIIVNTRNSHKNIISSVRASLSKIDPKPPRIESRKYSAEGKRVETPKIKQSADLDAIRPQHPVPTQNPKPQGVIRKKSNIKKTEKNVVDEQIKNQLIDLETQEKALENELNNIDQLGYKERLFESLQAITEEAKEMEESSKGSVFKAFGAEKKEIIEKNEKSEKIEPNKVTEIKVKQYLFGQKELVKPIEEEQEKTIEKLDEEEGFVNADGGEIVAKNQKNSGKYARRGRGTWKQQQDAYGKRGVSEGVMMKSQYSEESRISMNTKITGKGSKENLNSEAKDYVRVNPKIDIKKLLYS